MESLKPLSEMAACLLLAVEDIQITQHLLASQRKSVANKIVTSFDEFHTVTCTNVLFHLTIASWFVSCSSGGSDSFV